MVYSKRIFFFFKRLFDIVFSVLGIIVAFPVFVLIIILILLQDGLPVFFYDIRVGRNSRQFKTIKFRSMIKDAEKMLGSVYSIVGDPRVTPLGNILRATAMDELPQLINILKGDMSFVGPRPEKVNYVEALKKELPGYDRRHLLRPGLTGPAQVYLKYDSDAKEKIQYDLFYIDKANFSLDLKLIIKSFAITFKAGWEKFENNENKFRALP